MNLEELHENLPSAQDEVLRARRIDSAYNIGDQFQSELEIQLNVTLDGLSDLCYQLPSSPKNSNRTQAITLELVEARKESETESAQPAGRIVAQIVQIAQDAHNRQWKEKHYQAPKSKYAEKAFDIFFYFVADNDEKAAEICLETTVWQPSEKAEEGYYFDKFSQDGVASPLMYKPHPSQTTSEHEEELQAYLDVYVPRRKQQLTEISESVSLIESALYDPKLNPWFREYQKSIRAKAEEDRQREEAQHARSQEVVQSSGQVAVRSRSRRIGLFGPR